MTRCMDVVEAKGVCKDREVWIKLADELFNPHHIDSVRTHNSRLSRVEPKAEPSTSGVGQTYSNLSRSFSFMERKKSCKEANVEQNERRAGIRELAASISLQESRNTENLSDEELPFFLKSDDVVNSKATTIEELAQSTPLPKIFRGSLKDYQGLEGFSVLGSSPSEDNDSTHHQRLRKSVSDTTTGAEKSSPVQDSTQDVKPAGATKKLSKSDKSSLEDWNESNAPTKAVLVALRTESSADSDYSFESHASSSVESRSPRELEECYEVFLEPPSSLKEKRNMAGVLLEGKNKKSGSTGSVSGSCDDILGNNLVEEIVMTTRKKLAIHKTLTSSSKAVLSSIKDTEKEGLHIPDFDNYLLCNSQDTSNVSSQSLIKTDNASLSTSSSGSSTTDRQNLTSILRSKFFEMNEEQVNIDGKTQQVVVTNDQSPNSANNSSKLIIKESVDRDSESINPCCSIDSQKSQHSEHSPAEQLKCSPLGYSDGATELVTSSRFMDPSSAVKTGEIPHGNFSWSRASGLPGGLAMFTPLVVCIYQNFERNVLNGSNQIRSVNINVE
uniref:Uncharacterized protein n=1 Tax=Timema cristinae TaxID=61476 RepID=A0A7R9CZM8_TIMCR|nr:unnamed protein product [Timema cristinae]